MRRGLLGAAVLAAALTVVPAAPAPATHDELVGTLWWSATDDQGVHQVFRGGHYANLAGDDPAASAGEHLAWVEHDVHPRICVAKDLSIPTCGPVGWGTEPAWSPDSTELAYRTMSGAVAVVDADGVGARVVYRGPEPVAGGPDWAPDGGALAVAVGSAVVIVDRSGEVRTVHTEPEADLADAAWSPDGRTIAVTRRTAGVPTLLLVDAASGAVTDSGIAGWGPAWSHAGSHLAHGTADGRQIGVTPLSDPGSTRIVSEAQTIISAPSWQGPLPFFPPNVNAAGDIGAIQLDWRSSFEEEGDTAVIERRADVSQDWTTLAVVPAVPRYYTDAEVESGTRYWYRVRLVHPQWGQTGWSQPSVAQTLGRPFQPAEIEGTLALDETGLRIHVDWDDYDLLVDGLRLYRAAAEEGPYQLVADMPGDRGTHDDLALAPDTTYWYKASAYNADGEGPLSLAFPATTGVVPPSAPQDLNVREASASTIEVTWRPPLDDGGWPVVEYMVDSSRTTPFTTTSLGAILGLDAGLSLDVTVSARNGAGWGPAATVTYDPALRLGAPLDLAVDAPQEAGALELTWASPEGDPAVEAYRVRRREVWGAPWTLVATLNTDARSYLDTGLGNATTYHYQVTAVSSAGDGAPATASGSTHRPPSPPQSVSAQSGDAEIIVTWAPPLYSGLPVDRYVVYRAEGLSTTTSADLVAIVDSGSPLSFTDTDVVVGSWYRYEVAAVSEAGEGPVASRSVRVMSRPSAPLHVQARPDGLDPAAGAVLITWQAPASWGGTFIDEYVVYGRDLAGVVSEIGRVPAQQRSFRTALLLPSGTTEYAVSAVNLIGEGPRSEWVSLQVL